MEDVKKIKWEEMEDIGIVKMGNKKKIMIEIKRVKDVSDGKRFKMKMGEEIVINNI